MLKKILLFFIMFSTVTLAQFRVDSIKVNNKLFIGTTDRAPFLNALTDSNTILNSAISDSQITLQKMTTATVNFIGAGGSITNQPDDETLENKTDSTLGITHKYLVDSVGASIADSLNQSNIINSASIIDGSVVAGTDLDYDNGNIDGLGLTQENFVLGTSVTELNVNVDDATIEISTDTLQVKDAGVTTAKFASNSYAQNWLAPVLHYGANDSLLFVKYGTAQDSIIYFHLPVQSLAFGQTVVLDSVYIYANGLFGEDINTYYIYSNTNGTLTQRYSANGNNFDATGNQTFVYVSNATIHATEAMLLGLDISVTEIKIFSFKFFYTVQ